MNFQPTVVIRADRNTPFKLLDRVFTECQQARLPQVCGEGREQDDQVGAELRECSATGG